ncbi:MAG: phospholipase D-like domain-containing protein [Prolixibacteraceae bacterium]|jgi:phosphatidylserine/phosphatidylglycerophosphate/cardiolipin synthase-like enzyme
MDKITQYLTENFGKPFSNGTKQEIADLINALSREEIGDLRYRLFNEARKLEQTNNGQQALFWLQNCFDLIGEYKFSMHRVLFSPGTDILESISDLLNQAKQTLDICVFTITDDRLAGDIELSHKRGVNVRIITDDEKLYDHGSRIKDLKKAGIPVMTDHSRYHMHHKFGIIDSRIVFTGSFNWTYSASKHNQENLLITTNYDIVKQYSDQYKILWGEMFKL